MEEEVSLPSSGTTNNSVNPGRSCDPFLLFAKSAAAATVLK